MEEEREREGGREREKERERARVSERERERERETDRERERVSERQCPSPHPNALWWPSELAAAPLSTSYSRCRLDPELWLMAVEKERQHERGRVRTRVCQRFVTKKEPNKKRKKNNQGFV